ncbi:MAG: MinD/ParA family protein [Chloroflexota bacterium]
MSQIVSIHSFRGGTGKSNITANLAALIALRGKRVGIVDTDIQSPGIHVMFGLDHQSMGHTLNDFLYGKCTIEEVAILVGEQANKGSTPSQLRDQKLWLIPASIDGVEIGRILREGYDVNLLNQGLHTLRKSLDLDYLFIDTHPGLNDETLLSLAISDTLLLIMRPDQQDFQGTIVTVDVAQSLEVPHLLLVVNKALTKYDFKQMKADIETVYQVPVAGVLPLSEELVDLASGDLFALHAPQHAWSQTLQSIAGQLLEGL